MCQKYAEFSMVNEKRAHKLAEVANEQKEGRVKNLICLTCRNCCPDLEFQFGGKCMHYSKRMTLRELNKEIKVQNINLRILCRDNSLSYGKMKDMLKGKIYLTYKYYFYLERRILEKDEYLPYIEKFESEGVYE